MPENLHQPNDHRPAHAAGVNIAGRRVLVTGAGGFIGSHLAERLVREGAIVRAMVQYDALGSRGWLETSPLAGDMDIIPGDVTDPESTRESLRDVDTVFHLAALIAIPWSYSAPRAYLRTNAEGTLNVLLAARDEGVRRFVHTSTSEVYGTARVVPITEEHPLNAQSPYAASKLAADQIAASFACSYDVPVVTVRPFNTFGPRQSPRAVLPTIINQCLAIQRGVHDAIHLGATTPTRDLNYVENTVDGFLAAATASTACLGSTVNLGSGREISVADLARSIATIVGVPGDILEDARRLRPAASEVQRLLADNRLAHELLGWKPIVGFDEGLRRTVAWFTEHGFDSIPHPARTLAGSAAEYAI